MTVLKMQPILLWDEPDSIPYSTALSALQLNAVCTNDVIGEFVYSPGIGTVLPIGEHTLNVTFHAIDGKNFSSAEASVIVKIVEAIRPNIFWHPPSPIVFGTPLSDEQLCAICTDDVEGDFEYNPPTGVILPAGIGRKLTLLQVGDHLLTATFSPIDLIHYEPSSLKLNITVIPFTPNIEWHPPSFLMAGTHLTDKLLNATCVDLIEENIDGDFSYEPTFGTKLPAGIHELQAKFYPHDRYCYSTVTFGTPLSKDQLNAICVEDIEGSFVYSHPEGAILEGDMNHHIVVHFYPLDSDNYFTVRKSVILTVIKQQEVPLTWNKPSAIKYGTPLSDLQLNAYSGANVSGLFDYRPCHAGTNQKLSVAFTAKENKYLQLDAVVFIDVLKIPTSIFWEIPAVIRAGIELSSSVLNAICNEGIDGIIEYYPPVGTVLPAGDHILAATFTPSNEAQYASSKSFVQLK
eukprot:gene18039-18276_t